jgi:hypothetical protein
LGRVLFFVVEFSLEVALVDVPGIKAAVEKGSIEWNRHALERMMERAVRRETVKMVLLTGEVIEDYPQDSPYPSALFLGYSDNMPYHVAAAFDAETGHCYVITVYVPDLEHFEADYKTRREHEA